MSDSRSFEVLTASPVRLWSSPARSYRSWSDEEKARIVGETLIAGANVSAIARSNGLDPSQLFAWRRKAMASGVVAPLVGAPSRPVKFARFEAMRSDLVEIVIGDVVVRAGGDVDPQKPVDAQSEPRRNALNQWVANTLMSRLDNKQTGAIIVVMQRVHMDDLSGFLSDATDDWKILSLPAIAEVEETIPIGNGKFHHRHVGEALHPALESLDTIRKQQQTMGPDVFAAQYQQSPVPPGGAMIKRVWLRYYDEVPERPYYAKVIQSWDTAAKDGAQNDWSVCTTWLVVDDQFYLLDLTRGRYEYPQLRDTAVALAKRFRPNEILIEEASTGIALAQEMKQIHSYYINPIPVGKDKVGRLYVQQAKFAAGRVHFPRGAPFLAELEAELLAFPQARTDDQVDSISQALAYERSRFDSSFRWV